MIKLINIFFCLWACSIQRGLGNNQAAINSRYQIWISNAVVPPYRTAYTTLNEQIIQKLLTADTESDEATIRPLIQGLVCAAQTVHDQLHSASEASEQIRASLDHEVTSLQSSVAQQEKQLQWNQKYVSDANVNIEHAREKVISDESALRDYQHSFDTAEHDFQQAQKAVERSHGCGRRRKKRFLGDLFRHNPLCTIFGMSGTHNAQERVLITHQMMHQARHRLNYQQQNLANQRSREKTADSRLQQVTTQLNIIQNKLREKQASQERMASLTEQFKNVEVHLSNVLDSSVVLQDAVMNLIDFEIVIAPLNAIYREMRTGNTIEAFDTEISAKTTSQSSAVLKKLTEKMPKMPINEFTTSAMGTACN